MYCTSASNSLAEVRGVRAVSQILSTEFLRTTCHEQVTDSFAFTCNLVVILTGGTGGVWNGIKKGNGAGYSSSKLLLFRAHGPFL